MRLARSPETWLAGLPGELMSLLVTLEAKITSYPPLSYKPDYSVGFARSAGVAACSWFPRILRAITRARAS
jgi:hypothetical protein